VRYTLLVCLALVLTGPELRAETRIFVRPQHGIRRAHARHVQGSSPTKPQADFDPPEITIGERLFLETRFAQFFAVNSNGDVNQPLAQGDPVLDQVQTTNGPLPGPFAGQSMNCRSCHFVDEFADTPDAGNRTYADFISRSPVPAREDGHLTAPRNALNMVDSSIARPVGLFLHGDGEFSSLTTLVESTATGRNFGWLPSEYEQSVAHIAKVIREDDGTGALAQEFGGAYAKIFLGTAPDIPDEFRLPPEYRMEVTTATDHQIVGGVSRLIAAYVFSLTFSRDATGVHDGSPYDLFLAKNNLPAAPNPGESDADYSLRLFQAVNGLQSPQYVAEDEGEFGTHDQKFVFGPLELQGLKIFLSQSTQSASRHSRSGRAFRFATTLPAIGFVSLGWAAARKRRYGIFSVALVGCLCCGLMACAGNPATTPRQVGEPGAEASHVGNCVTCHSAPNFTDFRLHNTGASQDEYDAIHGSGGFANLTIPGFDERQQNPDAYLPPTRQHPSASGIFRSPVSPADPRLADLGMWNVYANPDFPEPQQQLQDVMCDPGSPCDPGDVLPSTVGRFKTPTLRDLGHSQPYFHSGRINSLEGVLGFYRRMSDLARAGNLRNGDPAIAGISIDDRDAAALAAFLRALNEDYD
jgi:hypothetical protein